MIEMPFNSPADFLGAVRPPEDAGEGLWFVFRGDRLLVELGPPSPRPSDDPRVPVRPKITSEGSMRPSSAAFILPTPYCSEINCGSLTPNACGSSVSSMERPAAPAASSSCTVRRTLSALP